MVEDNTKEIRWRVYQLRQGMVDSKGRFKGFIETSKYMLKRTYDPHTEQFSVDKHEEIQVKTLLMEELVKLVKQIQKKKLVKPYGRVIKTGFGTGGVISND